MNGRRRFRRGVLILIAAGLAACGSQSRANEAEQAADDAPAPAEAAPAAGATATPPAPEAPVPAHAGRTDRPTTTVAPRTRPTSGPEPVTAPEAESDAEPEPATVTVAAGTAVPATLDAEISTRTARAGDPFTATVSAPVVEGRRVLIPAGATIRGEVTAVRKRTDEREAGLVLALRTLTVDGDRYDLAASLTSVTPRTEREMKDEGKKIGGGAAAGGLLGAILGGDVKGAVIGAAAGAAAGTAVTLATREEHAVLPAGSAMELTLEEDLRVRM